MYEVVKSPLAARDLKCIWNYRFKKWGENKATEYLMQLDERIKALGEKPEIGKSRENIRRGYRSIRVNSHVVYYHLQVQKIDIVRALHKGMEVKKICHRSGTI